MSESRQSLVGWLGWTELKTLNLWRAATAECLGTLLLVFIGCGTCLGEQAWETAATPTAVQISLAFGLIVATVVWCICHVSGGHVNPAVSLAMCATRYTSLTRTAVYIVAQCIGAVFGAMILAGVTKKNTWGNLGMTTIDRTLSVGQGFGVELMITFTLVLTVFACCDKGRHDVKGSIPLTIGLTVTACHLIAIKYTGSSMNPARSFGPAVVTSNYPPRTAEYAACLQRASNTTTAVHCTEDYENIWSNHWVYWLGPMFGALCAAFLYEFLLAVHATRPRALFTCQQLDTNTSSYDVIVKTDPSVHYEATHDKIVVN